MQYFDWWNKAKSTSIITKNSCVYLFLYLQVTKNEAAAEATVAASSSLAASQAALANFAPVVHNANVTLNVSLNKIVINVSLLTSLWYTYVPPLDAWEDNSKIESKYLIQSIWSNKRLL